MLQNKEYRVLRMPPVTMPSSKGFSALRRVGAGAAPDPIP
jgi:hypothetical protein